MIDYTAPTAITIINIIIIIYLVRAVIKYKQVDIPMYNLSRLLLIANTFAFITGFIDYFMVHNTTATVLQMGRFADRYVMMFAYVTLAEFRQTKTI